MGELPCFVVLICFYVDKLINGGFFFYVSVLYMYCKVTSAAFFKKKLDMIF